MGNLRELFANRILNRCFQNRNGRVNYAVATKRVRKRCIEHQLRDYKSALTLKRRRRRHVNNNGYEPNNNSNNNNSNNNNNNNNNDRIGRIIKNFARREAAGESRVLAAARLSKSLLGSARNSSVWQRPGKSRK
jgi:hypothetical protein